MVPREGIAVDLGNAAGVYWLVRMAGVIPWPVVGSGTVRWLGRIVPPLLPSLGRLENGCGRTRAWWMKGASGDAAWRALSLRDKFFHELGKKTTNERVLSMIKDMAPVDAGRMLWERQGLRSLWPSVGQFWYTWSTGPTAGARYMLPKLGQGLVGAGAAYYVLSDE
jgi:hypothetical protein